MVRTVRLNSTPSAVIPSSTAVPLRISRCPCARAPVTMSESGPTAQPATMSTGRGLPKSALRFDLSAPHCQRRLAMQRKKVES